MQKIYIIEKNNTHNNVCFSIKRNALKYVAHFETPTKAEGLV